MIGPLAKATYFKTWLAAEYQKVSAGSFTLVPDPLCLYKSSHSHDKLIQEEKEKHIGNLHLNITRHVYLGIPTTASNQINQFGKIHCALIEIPPLQHLENYTVYFEEYNLNRVLSYRDENPIQSKADAEQALKTALQQAHEERVPVTLLPDRGSSTKIKENLEAAIKKHVQDISMAISRTNHASYHTRSCNFMLKKPQHTLVLRCLSSPRSQRRCSSSKLRC
jgi:hypothetical protein